MPVDVRVFGIVCLHNEIKTIKNLKAALMPLAVTKKIVISFLFFKVETSNH